MKKALVLLSVCFLVVCVACSSTWQVQRPDVARDLAQGARTRAARLRSDGRAFLAAIQEQESDSRSLQIRLSTLQADMRKLEKGISDMEARIARTKGDEAAALSSILRGMQYERRALKAGIDAVLTQQLDLQASLKRQRRAAQTYLDEAGRLEQEAEDYEQLAKELARSG